MRPWQGTHSQQQQQRADPAAWIATSHSVSCSSSPHPAQALQGAGTRRQRQTCTGGTNTEPGQAARGWHSSDHSAVSAAPSPATHGVSPACPIPVLSSQEASDGCWHPWAMAVEALLATRGCPAPGRCPELIRSHSRTEVRWRAQHSSPHTASFKFPKEAAEV